LQSATPRLTAEREIARFGGVFAEPASSATIAALEKLLAEGVVDRGDRVVCLITGSGLKATDILQALTKKRKTAIVGLDRILTDITSGRNLGEQ